MNDKNAKKLEDLEEGLCYLCKSDGKMYAIPSGYIYDYFTAVSFTNIEYVEKNYDVFKNLFRATNYGVSGGQLDDIERQFLHYFVEFIKPKKIIEFSCAAGCSTVTISKALKMQNIVPDYFETHDIDPKCTEATKALLDGNDIKFVNIKLGDVFETMNYENLKNADFVFIDSDHRKEFCEKYAKEILPLIKSNAWVAVHDIVLRPAPNTNDESQIIKKFVLDNNIEEFFHIADAMAILGIPNDFRPWQKNTMFFFKVK